MLGFIKIIEYAYRIVINSDRVKDRIKLALRKISS